MNPLSAFGIFAPLFIVTSVHLLAFFCTLFPESGYTIFTFSYPHSSHLFLSIKLASIITLLLMFPVQAYGRTTYLITTMQLVPRGGAEQCPSDGCGHELMRTRLQSSKDGW